MNASLQACSHNAFRSCAPVLCVHIDRVSDDKDASRMWHAFCVAARSSVDAMPFFEVCNLLKILLVFQTAFAYAMQGDECPTDAHVPRLQGPRSLCPSHRPWMQCRRPQPGQTSSTLKRHASWQTPYTEIGPRLPMHPPPLPSNPPEETTAAQNRGPVSTSHGWRRP